MQNWAINMHFNPIPILSGLFLGGGTKRPPPRLCIDSDPPTFLGLMRKYMFWSENLMSKSIQIICIDKKKGFKTHVYIQQYIYLFSAYLSIFSLSIYLSSAYLSIYLQPIYLSIFNLSIYLSFHFSVYSGSAGLSLSRPTTGLVQESCLHSL